MPILLYQLRARPDRKIMEYTEPNWQVNHVADLFRDPDRILSRIPSDERYNVYYTVADVHVERVGGKSRQLKRQDWLPIDIDHVNVEHITDVLEVVCGVLGVEPSGVLSMFSGHGVQVLINLVKPITDVRYFDDYRSCYRAMCDQINAELGAKGLSGTADPKVFSGARLMRMPNTINRKPIIPDPNKEPLPDVLAYVINAQAVSYDLDLQVKFGEGLGDFLPRDYTTKFPTPDVPQIWADCLFLNHCKINAAVLPEPHWYAMAGIVGRMPEGHKTFHELSKPHPGYTPEQAQAKLEQALERAGPATCKYIATMFEGCKSCVHYNKCTSPITIRGEEFILTEKSGFHFITDKKPVPDYEGLRKYFNKKHQYITIKELSDVYKFNGKSWEHVTPLELFGFAYEHFNPKPGVKMTKEFTHALVSEPSKQRKYSWFTDSTYKLMNFNNTVLNLDTMECLPHSPDYGFRHILPYDYDPLATAPVFEKFLDDILLGDIELKQLILEFMGYVVSGDEPWAQVSMILKGGGSNGKSTLLKVVRGLIGNGAISSVSSEKFNDEKYLYFMADKLLNISEETPRDGLIRSSDFKALTSGETMTARPVYKQPVEFRPRVKLMFACNELPAVRDVEYGFFRRILLIPFEYTILPEKVDITMDKKLAKELPGILNLCLQAYKIAYKRKSFTQAQAAMDEKESYKFAVDSILAFIDEHVTVTGLESDFISRSDLYAAYAADMKRGNQKPIARTKFMHQIAKYIPNYDEKVVVRRVSGGLMRGISGIRVNLDPFGDVMPENVDVN